MVLAEPYIDLFSIGIIITKCLMKFWSNKKTLFFQEIGFVMCTKHRLLSHKLSTLAYGWKARPLKAFRNIEFIILKKSMLVEGDPQGDFEMQPIVKICKCHICPLMRLFFSTLSEAEWRIWARPSLVQILACRLFGAKPLSEPIMACFQMDPWEHISHTCMRRWIGSFR